MKNILFAFVFLFASNVFAGVFGSDLSVNGFVGTVTSDLGEITTAQIIASCTPKSQWKDPDEIVINNIVIVKLSNNLYSLRIPAFSLPTAKAKNIQSCDIRLFVGEVGSEKRLASATLAGSNSLMTQQEISLMLANRVNLTNTIRSRLNSAKVVVSDQTLSGYALELSNTPNN